MRHCIQLKSAFDLSAVNQADAVFHREFSKRQKYNHELDAKYAAIPTSIYTIANSVKDDLLRQLPQAVLDIEVPQVFILKIEASDKQLPVLAAHVDFNRSCGINIYLEANGEITQYYDWDSESKALTEVEHFVAKQGECWLMDTQVPHAVSLKTGKQRSMLTFSFVRAPYEQVKEAMGVLHA